MINAQSRVVCTVECMTTIVDEDDRWVRPACILKGTTLLVIDFPERRIYKDKSNETERDDYVTLRSIPYDFLRDRRFIDDCCTMPLGQFLACFEEQPW